MENRICGAYLANGTPVGNGKIRHCPYWGRLIWQDRHDPHYREFVIIGTRANGHDVVVEET